MGGFYQALGMPGEPEQATVHLLRLESRSRILSLPTSESGIRGFTPNLIVVDEAARVDDSLYEAVSPMLAVSGGRLNRHEHSRPVSAVGGGRRENRIAGIT